MLREEINNPNRKSENEILKETFDRKRSSLSLGAKPRPNENFQLDKKFYKKFYADTVHKTWQAFGTGAQVFRSCRL